MKVGLIQQHNTSDVKDNIQRLVQKVRECAAQGAELVVMQELHNALYFCQEEDVNQFDLAETIPGPSTDTFSALAKELKVVIVLSLFEKRAVGLYHNTAVVIEKDGTIAGAYYEKFYFTPGDLGFNPIKTSVGTLCVLVCWDQWYPEAARLMALAGADLLIYPTAIGWESTDPQDEKDRQLDAWIISQRGHAVANGLPVVSVNRVGYEADPSGVTNGITFWGDSFVAGPQGEFLARLSNTEEQIAVVEVSLKRSEDVRRIWPFLRDRRIDSYTEILRRYRD